MRIKQLKKLNEKLPDGIKMLCAPFIRRSLINNAVFKNQYQELELLEKMTPKQQKQIQMENLRQILIYAYNSTTYYKHLFDSIGFEPEKFSDTNQISCIPILTKELLRNNLEDIQVSDCKNFYSTTTGGTTGMPVHILLDKESIYREKAFIYHYWSKLGYNYKTSRIATFRGINFDGKICKVNPLYNEIQLNPFMLNVHTIKQYVSKIERFGAEFIHGYPSAIYAFCSCMEQVGIQLKKDIQAVFFISENVYPFQNEKIEKVLHCKTFAFYGHSERAVFAEQDEKGTYTFQPAYGYAEIDEKGRILCTGFINRKMPLIRYDTEDFARILPDGQVEIEGHHNSEVLYGVHGEEISAAAINFHVNIMDDVEVYQFVQNAKGKATIRVVSKNGKKLNLQGIQTAVQNKLGQALQIKVQQVESVEYSNRGKYRMIIQHIK